MKILIIGGSRFVGPHLIEKLLKKNHSVTVFNRGNIRSHYEKEIIFIQGDRDRGFSFSTHFDTVIDMCAYFGKQTEQAIKQINFDFFINFGTAASYKKSEIFPLTEDFPVGEWPAWGQYNKGKVECENVLQMSGRKYASIRPVYILGPANYVDREKFIYSKIKKGETLTLPGNGQAMVQFIFVEEVAEIVTLLAERQAEGLYNCAGNEMITLSGLVEEMGKIMGVSAKIGFDQNKDGGKFDEREFPFANENFICSNSRIKNLGIDLTPLLEGLERDYKNYYKDQLG